MSEFPIRVAKGMPSASDGTGLYCTPGRFPGDDREKWVPADAPKAPY